MAETHRPVIFQWRHFAPEIILCAVRWYLRYSLTYRDVQELLVGRDLNVDPTTVWRWVQRYAPERDEGTRPHLKPTHKSWLFFGDLLGAYLGTPGEKNSPYYASIETVQGNLASAAADVARVGPTVLTAIMNPNSLMQIFQYNLNSSYEMKFNFAIERQLGGNVSVVAGYIGGRGIHLWRETDANDAPPLLVSGRPFVIAGTPRLNPHTGDGPFAIPMPSYSTTGCK